MQEIVKKKLVEIPELGYYGVSLWLIELPTRTPDGWFIEPLTGWKPDSGEMPPQPKYIPLSKFVIEWKKKWGEPKCIVLIKWGSSSFHLLQEEEINPHYIAGVSLGEALMSDMIQ
jgi:hypothetical protein